MNIRFKGVAQSKIIAIAITSTSMALGLAPAAYATSLQDQVNAAITAGQTSVTLTPGTYNIASGSAITLSGTTNLSILANSVYIVMNTYAPAISLTNCSSVEFYNAIIDYDPLPFVEGTINSVTTNASHKITSVNVTFDAVPPSTLVLNTTGLGIALGVITDATTSSIKRGSGSHYIDSVCGPNLDGSYTVNFNPCNPIKDSTSAGDEISFPVAPESAVAIALEECGGCLIQGVTLYSSPSIGIHDLDSGTGSSTSANEYLHNSIIPAAGRFRSVNAGGIICRRALAGPTIENNTITDAGDDAIAVHTYMAQVTTGVTGSTTCTIGTKLGINNMFASGDVVKIFAPNGSGVFGTASPAFSTATLTGSPTETAAGSPGVTTGCTTTPYTLYNYTLTFTSPVTLPAGTWLQDESASDTSFYIAANTITSTRGRGIYARGDDGDVFNNTVSYTAMAGILVEPEVVAGSPFLDEGNLTDGMEINENTVTKALWGWTNVSENAAGAISVLISDPTWGPWGHTNMEIGSNTLNSCPGVQILLQSVQTCTVEDNTFNYPGVNNVTPSTGSALSVPAYDVVDSTGTCDALIWISNVDTVTFENMNIYNAGNGADGNALYDYDGCVGSPTNPPAGSQVTNITLWNGLSNAFKWH